MNAEQTRREDCRHAVLQALYHRQTGAHEAATLRSVFLKRFDFTLDEVNAALQLLAGLGLVQSTPDPLGSTLAWQITAQGVLQVERH